ncbi:MAG: hypothetical protein ACK5YQ_12060, partial [Betaproteobacteria bacterium]
PTTHPKHFLTVEEQSVGLKSLGLKAEVQGDSVEKPVQVGPRSEPKPQVDWVASRARRYGTGKTRLEDELREALYLLCG